jgi:hypothetical protein
LLHLALLICIFTHTVGKATLNIADCTNLR